MKKIRLNESDLKYMIRKAVNEVLAYEGEDGGKPEHDRYYFGGGWEKPSGESNPFTAEGSVGDGFEEFAGELKSYIEEELNKPNLAAEWCKKARAEFEEFLAKEEALFKKRDARSPGYGDYIKRYNEEYPIRRIHNGHDYVEVEFPSYIINRKKFEELATRVAHSESSYEYYEERRKHKIIAVEMPKPESGGMLDKGWRDFAQVSPRTKGVRIDFDDIEGSAAKAWDIFNNYASQTPEVIGWYLWRWSTFPPTLRPILTPEVGEEISGESRKISDFYNSLDYKGD